MIRPIKRSEWRAGLMEDRSQKQLAAVAVTERDKQCCHEALLAAIRVLLSSHVEVENKCCAGWHLAAIQKS